MRRIAWIMAIAVAAAPSAATAAPAGASDGIVRADARLAVPGSPANFTGKATVRPIVDAAQIGQTTIGEVVFQPGARSRWHTHPGGQAIYVTQGCGWTQREGGPVVRICKGDTAFVPAGIKHWHGAAAKSGMVQFSVTETIGGRTVTWLEPVTDAQYQAGATAVR